MDLFKIERYNEDTIEPAVDQLTNLKAKINTKKIKYLKEQKKEEKEKKKRCSEKDEVAVEECRTESSNIKKSKRKKNNENVKITENLNEVTEIEVDNSSTFDGSNSIEVNNDFDSLDVIDKINNDKTTQINESSMTILDKHKKIKHMDVKRTLPKWINNQKPISSDIQNDKTHLKDISYLNNDIKKLLMKNNIEFLFPVQSTVIPYILHENDRLLSKQFQTRDICVQSPTGSGKTLSYVLPIVQILMRKIIRQLSCIVVLPSTDLAVQVKHVFDSYVQASSCNLKVALLSGLNTFAKEQCKLVQKGSLGNLTCKVDIVVCTPGRLVDHIRMTKGFSFEYLQFLVIDEADKLLSQDYSGWLGLVMNAVYSKKGDKKKLRTPYFPINVSNFQQCQLPLQKLLFSATLTQNPEKLSQLFLFNPVLFVTQITNKITSTDDNVLEATPVKDDDILNAERNGHERFVLPANLQQRMIVVNNTSEKPLVLLYILLTMSYKRILCFTRSVEATHRLYHLLQAIDGLKVSEFSSNLSEVHRKGIIRDFKNGEVNIIVSSDVMARGMHIDNVQLVVNYDAPANEKCYVHRVGRTARAGTEGLAMTILAGKEVYHFKQMCKCLSSSCSRMKIAHDSLSEYVQMYEEALQRLREKVNEEKRKK